MTTLPQPLAPPAAPDDAPGPTAGAGPRMRYLPGLDGLRALAVTAVLLYHYKEDGSWLPGGYLGVEVFFVISGFLITALLLAETKRTGTIDLGSFWARRARRLLPALFLLLGAVVVVSVLFLPDEVASLRGDVLAALTYTTNWYQIFAEQSYFEAVGRPPLLQHLWSLAVEEQFYLFWPLIFGFGMKRLGRNRFFAAIVVGIVASTALMWLLYSPLEDPTRVYYGTDTRAAGLLIGAALAFVWSPWRLRRRTGRGAGLLLDVVGVLALVQLLRTFDSLGEFDPALYQGGFLLVGLVTAAVIAVVVHPSSRLGGLHVEGPGRWLTMANPVLLWVGLRSYGIYLWHWPVFQLTRPDLDVTWPAAVLFIVRFGATLVLAEVSYRFVEVPIRSGALRRWWGRVRSAPSPQRTGARLRGGLALGVSVAVLGLLGTALVRAEAPEAPAFLAAGASTQAGALPPSVDETVPPPVAVDPTGTAAPEPTEATTTTAAPDPAPPAGDPAAPAPEPAPAPVETAPPPPPPAVTPVDLGRVTAVGDSVMAGAAPQVYEKLSGKAHVDAAVNRQVGTGIEIFQAWRDAGLLGDVVLVHLGNNGTFTDAQLDQRMQVLAGVPRVGLLTNKVPRAWEASNNAVILSAPQRYPNVVLVDWKGHSDAHPEWFYDDGIHLRPDGARAYAEFIAATLGG